MAVDFSAGSSHLLASAATVSYPFTISLKVRFPETTTDQYFFSITDSSVTDDAFWLWGRGTSTDFIGFSARASGSGATAYTPNTYSANTWHHVIAVASSATSRLVYLDNGSAGSSSTSITPSGLDRVGIGSLARAFVNYGTCVLAEVAIYNFGLGTTARNQLWSGINPLEARIDGLTDYWPLLESGSVSLNLVSGRNATWNGSPAAYPHPRTLQALFPTYRFPPPSIAGGATAGIRNPFRGPVSLRSPF